MYEFFKAVEYYTSLWKGNIYNKKLTFNITERPGRAGENNANIQNACQQALAYGVTEAAFTLDTLSRYSSYSSHGLTDAAWIAAVSQLINDPTSQVTNITLIARNLTIDTFEQFLDALNNRENKLSINLLHTKIDDQTRLNELIKTSEKNIQVNNIEPANPRINNCYH